MKEVSDHKKLAILDLSHNNLKNLDVQLFNRLSEIKCLNISWNRVEEITEKHFENLYYVRKYYLKPTKIFSKTFNF